jgi:hypothetical protein
MAENRRNVFVFGCSKVGETPMYHIKKQPSDRSYGKMIAGWKWVGHRKMLDMDDKSCD